MVATLNGKAAMYRILRDEDFQKLLGLASEVHCIKEGISFVTKAAKIVAKHKDQESVELLIQSVDAGRVSHATGARRPRSASDYLPTGRRERRKRF